MKMKECTECLVQELAKTQNRNLYRGSARMMSMSVRGESVGEDCNVNCLKGLKPQKTLPEIYNPNVN